MSEPFSLASLRHPGCASVAAYADRLADERTWPSLEVLQARYADRLAIEPGITLVPPPPTPRGRRARRIDELYEMQIAVHGRLPTRPRSWHDLMNLLVWCAFPRSKRALVERHRAAITDGPSPRRGLSTARSPERDALSILDEGGALVLCRAPAVELDRPGALETALAEGRATVRLFGHALLEATVRGELAERDLRAAGVVCVVEDPSARSMDEVDRVLSQKIADPARFIAPDRRRTFWLCASGALSGLPNFSKSR